MKVEIAIVGESWGENEEKLRKAFVGSSGVLLLQMLAEGGVIELTSDDQSYIYRYWQERDPRYVDAVWRMHPEVYRTNVFNIRPRGNKIEDLCGTKPESISGYPMFAKSKYFRAEFSGQLDRLAEELLEQDPNLIIACGNTPSWALLGTTAITKIRGTTFLSTHTVAGFKVLPVFHPAAVMRTYEYRPITVVDFSKAARECKYPEIRRPARSIWIEPTLEDIREFKIAHIDNSPTLSVDIETAGRKITCIGFAPNPGLAIVIPFVRRGNYWKTAQAERAAWGIVRDILQDPRTAKTFQNGIYDIAFLWRAYGIKVYNAAEDTMLLHHALQPESVKDLGFLGSIYTDEGAWKRMRKVETIKIED